MIAKETKNGVELVTYALRVFRDPDDEFVHHQRWEALQWLADRGFGRPVISVDLDAALEVEQAQPKRVIDVTALDQGQHDALRTAISLVRGERPPLPVLDVPASDETTADDE